jgi:AraC-like DNA-binding protein
LWRRGDLTQNRHVVDQPGVVLESVQRLPAPALRPFVAWYTGYRQEGLPPGTHRGLPSPHLTVIITFDEPLSVAAHPDPRMPGGRYDTLVGGLHTAPAVIVHQGRQCGVQLALSPLGARALLGAPAGVLAGIDLDAADVLGPFARELHERVGCATTWPHRFAVLDELLLRRAGLEQAVPGEVAHAWERLLSTSGSVSVADLAREIGWSSRHLGNRFRTEIGLSPKEAARVVRFDRARRLLQATAGTGSRARIAEVATACGYYDQAHLARDFRSLAGCPPSTWLAEEFRNVQADAAGTVTRSSP